MPKCPNCESEDTIKVSQLYSKSTQSVNTTSTGGGVGFGSGGLGVGGGSMKTTGTVQTLEGSKLAPPKKPSNIGVGCLAYFVYVVIFFFTIDRLLIWTFGANSDFHEYGSYFFMVLGIIGVSIWASKRTENQMTDYQSEHDLWDKKWTCNRCGNVFYPPKN